MYAFWRQTVGRTNGWRASMRKGAFDVASGVLISPTNLVHYQQLMVVIPCLCPSSSLKPKGRRPEKTRQPFTKFCSWLYALRHWKTSPVFNVISPSFLRSYSEPLAMYMSAECWWRLQSFYARIMWPKNCSFHRWINWHMQLFKSSSYSIARFVLWFL